MLLSFHKTSGMRCRVRPSGKSCSCRAVSLLVFSLFILGLSAPSQAIVYVDKDRPGGNGTSWVQAYRTLENAINNTFSGQEFWIAEGTYTPGSPLVLTKNHSFYGGFAGTETARNQRDINGHPTVIDGQNILKHVFYSTHLATSVRFDGLTIKRGNANAASGEDSSGGGILVNKGAVVIANCTFQNNNAYHMGGAVHLVSCPSVLITNSEFTNNTVSKPTGMGGGVCILKSNDGTNPLATVEKSVFKNNSGGSLGGGLYSYYYSMLVRQCTFIGNTTGNGGGVFSDGKLPGADKIERCYFFDNSATDRGGAVATYARSIETENSVFGSNTTPAGGGAVSLHSGLGNGSYYNNAFSSIFRNCTFYNNQATSYGGGISNIGGHPMYIYNSIFWGNQGKPLYQDGATRNSDDIASHDSSIGAPTITMRYTDMESFGGADTPAHVSQVGCFSADPVLVDPDGPDNITGTSDDNLSIRYTSPCIDRADGNSAAAKDIEFRPRTDYGPTPNQGTGTPDYGDIGAYEGPSAGSPEPEVDGVSIVGPILKPLLLSP
jgi:Chlamydia polymorphic membrane protein (Chlamydia_PMP) repeat